MNARAMVCSLVWTGLRSNPVKSTLKLVRLWAPDTCVCNSKELCTHKEVPHESWHQSSRSTLAFAPEYLIYISICLTLSLSLSFLCLCLRSQGKCINHDPALRWCDGGPSCLHVRHDPCIGGGQRSMGRGFQDLIGVCPACAAWPTWDACCGNLPVHGSLAQECLVDMDFCLTSFLRKHLHLHLQKLTEQLPCCLECGRHFCKNSDI